jgi:hypothetical protein
MGDLGFEYHGYGGGYHVPMSYPSGLPPTFGTCEQSHSETLPAHLGSVLESHDLGQMGIMT